LPSLTAAAARAGFDDNQAVWVAGKPAYEPSGSLMSDTSADVAVIGGGFTGVSTAYHLKRRFPERRVVLLEAKVLANGASGRNGGLMLNWVNGVHSNDPEQAKRIYDVTCSGIDLIEEIIRAHGLSVAYRRTGCLEAFTDARRADAAAAEVERLRAAGLPLEFLDARALSDRVELAGAAGAVLDPTAGQIDGVDLVRGMKQVLLGLGVEIYEHTPVLRIEEGRVVVLRTPDAQVRADAIVLGTNAYTPALGYFGAGIVPLLSHLVATEPLDRDAWRDIGWRGDVAGFSDDLDRLAYGGLTARGELVFGGGSNAAYSYLFGSRTMQPVATAAPSFEAIQRRMLAYLPRAEHVRIRHRWSGPVALTMSRVCTMGVRGEHRNVYFALGYSGHGITLANLAGRVLCDIYSHDDARWRGLPFYQQRLLYVPPEPMRWLGYQVYTRLTGRSPRRSL
jgi:glycine/D-amino acid oxidase-like deaminating enzyme